MRQPPAIDRLRIYIAGPYSAAAEEDVQENVWRAIDVGLDVLRLGHIPYIPHMTLLADYRTRSAGKMLAYEDYMQWGIQWLLACDAILHFRKSPGADRELGIAKQQGLTVFRHVSEIAPAKNHGGMR